MAKILVYDVAAEYGGAATVLKSFYDECKNDNINQYYFVVSVFPLMNLDNITVVSLPWVKKSWFHRLFCDYIYMPIYVKKIKATKIVSLQNSGIGLCGIDQEIYVHNALFFTSHKFSFSESKSLWVYQNIIKRLVFHSIKSAKSIIVQTEWMKQAIIKNCNVSSDEIDVRPVKIDNDFGSFRTRNRTKNVLFFYPASCEIYKNHRVLVDACKLLNECFSGKFEVVLTISPSEAPIWLKKEIENNSLPISLIGRLSKEQMADWYNKSILIFPSYLETVGLPLIEAKMFNCDIIVSDCEYSHDAIGSYEKVKYFNYLSAKDLSDRMKEVF